MCFSNLLALLLEERKARDVEEKSAWHADHAAQTGDTDKYMELLAEGVRHASKQDWPRAARSCRAAMSLRPDEPMAYYNLGAALGNSGHHVEAAQRFLEAKERYAVGSEDWAKATADAFDMLRHKECGEVAKPEWWNDEGLKALSARVVRMVPNEVETNRMRAYVLCGQGGAWEVGARSAAELREAATHYDRTAALCDAPAGKAEFAHNAGWCRHQADVM